MNRGLFAAILLLSSAQVLCATAVVHLPEASTTSAGIFDSKGALVRTLWSGRRHEAGELSIEWDGRRDDGAASSPSERYVARVMAHNVRYVWEGVIGNTSSARSGTSVHRGFNPINDMAIDAAGHGFYVVGYNEQQNAIHRFDVKDTRRRVPLAHDDYRRLFRYAASDGTLAYFANTGVFAPPGSFNREPATFVIALRVSDGAEHRFAAGRVEMPNMPGNRWQSVIDYDRLDETVGNDFRYAPSGLAVQQRGNHLFVAHRALNEIRVFDKHRGVLLGRIPVTRPGDMDVAPDDSLWVLCFEGGRPAVAKYLYRGSRWVRDAVLSRGLTTPVAIGVSPTDGTVAVVDAGTEQVKAFDPLGNALWTLGRAGGYTDGNPEVTTERFWFSGGASYLTFQGDGSFWLGDPGNLRSLRFSAQRRYLDQIMYLPATYLVAVDPADPRRVFRHFMEFQVDYSRPLRESWTLVRNWAAGLDRNYQAAFGGFRYVHTLANGRTYAAVHRGDTRANEIVELTGTGVRPTGIRLEKGTRMHADGSLRLQQVRLRNLQVYSRRLTGFDAEGNPEWEAPARLGGVARLDDRDPYYHDVPLIFGMNEATYPITSTNVLVTFNPGMSEGFHLGGIRVGADAWLWRASPSGTWDVDSRGSIVNPDGRYELGRGVHYPGNVITTAGRHIVAGYHGEAWNQGQAGQWLHFLDNGLFVGQFGNPVYPANNRTDARPASAGNAFSSQLVSVGDEVYLWHNDESVQGGIHRWRIVGGDRIQTLEAPLRQ